MRAIWIGVMVSLAACSPGDFGEKRRDAEMRAASRADKDAAIDGSAEEEESEAVGKPAASAAGARAGADSDPGAGRSGASAGAGSTAGAAAGSTAGAGGAGAAAGAAGEAGQSSQAGAGAAGASGAPHAGSSGSPAPSCGDTKTDPKNCGSCGNECRAAAADVQCREAMCVRTCKADVADCNQDLGSGASGDGCETSITTLEHCGACETRCEKPVNGVAACEERACASYKLELGAPSPVSTMAHGHLPPTPYNQLCEPGHVLVGLDALTDGNVAWGFSVICAPITLGGTADKLSVSLGEPVVHKQSIGQGGGVMPTKRKVTCPPGAVINAVAGVLWYYDGPLGRFETPAIREIDLACSTIAIDAMRRIVYTPAVQLAIGNQMNLIGTYNDPCPAGHVVSGFMGNAVEWIDSLQTHCSPLTLVRSASAGGS